VIRKLSTMHGVEHVPYRDSTLTRILQPALGGNSKTAIICALSPALNSLEESLSTLKFASQAKMVKNMVSVNEIVDEAALLQRYKLQIEEMAAEMQNLKQGANVRDLETQLAQKEDEINRMKDMIVTSKSMKKESQRKVRCETWCAGLDGDYSIHMGAMNDEDDLMTRLVLADSENAATPKKKKKTSSQKKSVNFEEEKDSKVETLENELSDAKELQEALEEENRILDEKCKALSLKTEGWEHELTEARDRVAFLVETLQLTEDQMIDTRREAELYKAKEAQFEIQKKDLAKENDFLKDKLASVSSNEEKHMDVEELELEVQALKWEKKQMAEKLAGMESAVASATEAEAAAEAKIKVLETEMSQMEEQYAAEKKTHASQIEKLEAEIESVEALNEELMDTNNNHNVSEKKHFEKQLHTYAQKVDALESDLSLKNVEIIKISEERDSLVERLKTHELALQEEEQASEKKMETLQTQMRSISSVSDKIKALKSKKTEASESNLDAHKIERLQEENKQLKQQLQTRGIILDFFHLLYFLNKFFSNL
jgi:centromeric protein E